MAANPRAWRTITLGFGLVNIEVGLGKPDDDTKVPGKYICPVHHTPEVEQRYFCPEGEGHYIERELKDGTISHMPDRGYLWDGEYVVLTDEEKDMLREETTSRVEIDRACGVDEIDPIYYCADYLVWPINGHGQAYDVLSAVMRNNRIVLAGPVCLTNRTREFVLRWSPAFGHLVGHLCHFTDEIRWHNIDLIRAGIAERAAPTKQHVAAARPLVAALETPFDPSAVPDTYAAAMKSVLDASRKGKKRRVKKAAVKKGASPDLLAALRGSVKQIEEERRERAKK